MATNVGRLGVVLGIDTTELITGLGKASLEIAKFVDRAKPALLGAAAAMAALTAKAVAYADEVSDLATANDLAIGTVINLGLGLDNSGGKADSAGKLIAAFTSKIDQAAEGSKGAQRAFDRIGVSLGDLSSKSNQQLLEDTIAKIAAIEDPVTRNALAFETFGRAAKGVDFRQLNRELQENKQITEEQAIAIKAAGDVADKLNRIMKDLYITIATELGPKLLATVDYLNSLSGQASFVGDVFRTVFETIAILGANVYFVIERLGASVVALLESSGKALKGDFRGALDVFKGYNEESERLRENLDKFERRITNRGKNQEAELGGTTSNLLGEGGDRPVRNADEEARRKAELISQAYINQNDALREQLIRKGQLVYLTEREQQLASAVFQIEDDRLKKVQDLQRQISEERIKPEATRNDKLIGELELQVQVINNLAEAYKGLTIEQIKSQQAEQSTFEFGFNQSFKKFADDATNAAKIGAKAFDTFASASEKALDQFVRTGKVAFGDLVRDMLVELAKVEIKAQALSFFKGAGGGSGILSGIGSIFGFADGGAPPVGKPYLVGERGPEIKIDKSPSTIIPLNNGTLSSDNQAGGQVFNGPYIQNFSAIDAQSGLAFIANNRDAIWAASQKAGQGKPSSGRYY